MDEGGACGMARFPGTADEEPRERIRWGEERHLQLRGALAARRGVDDPFGHPLHLDDPEVDQWMRAVRIGPYAGGTPCPDCAVGPGGAHHEGCAKEECPACGMQALTCPCDLPGRVGGDPPGS